MSGTLEVRRVTGATFSAPLVEVDAQLVGRLLDLVAVSLNEADLQEVFGQIAFLDPPSAADGVQRARLSAGSATYGLRRFRGALQAALERFADSAERRVIGHGDEVIAALMADFQNRLEALPAEAEIQAEIRP